MELHERISMLRQKKQMTLEEVGNLVGVTKSTVRKWELGLISNMRRDKIKKLADALGTTPEFLMGWETVNGKVCTKPKTSSPHASSKKGVRIPILGNVAAGTPIEAIANEIDLNDSDNWEEIEDSIASTGNFFALKIKGRSMEPRIKEDDIVIVRQQPDVENGDLAVVYINGYDATVKEIKKLPSGIMLIGWNRENYEPHFYTYEETKTLPIKIVGKVIELRAKF